VLPIRSILVIVLACLFATSANAQLGPTPSESSSDSFNPLVMLEDAGTAINAASGFGARVQGSSPVPSESSPREGLSVTINIMLLLTVIALVPSIMLMTTSFIRIMVVLALLRQAMGTQSLPPGQVITGLALFMTALVMKPTIDRVWNEAVVPYQNGEIRNMDVLWERASNPMRDFMFDQIEATDNWSSLYMILNYQGVDTSEPESMTRADISTTTLIPAYMLSELKVSFLMGFRVYLPFLVIDMVIASLLISMSMMMLPPVLISLPFKLMLFVLVDGWTLIVGSLLESFVQEGTSTRLSATAAAAIPLFMLARIVKKGNSPPKITIEYEEAEP
jgi:flagellar biosynthesis protein FliP